MHFYSNNLSGIATIFPLFFLEMIPALFRSGNIFIVAHSSLVPYGKKNCGDPRSHDTR